MVAEYYPITGLKDAYIALGVVDTASAYSAGTPFETPPAENATWTITQASTPFFGFDAKQDDLPGSEISSAVIRLNGISEEMDAKIRGKARIASSGRIAGSGDTTPPLCALGLQIDKAPGEYVYVWFLKGRFSGGNIVAQTSADSKTINMREYTFTAVETTKKFTFTDAISGESKTTGLTWFKGETADDSFSATDWFTQVQTPDTTSAPSALALSTIVPDDEATEVLATADVVLTFNNKIASHSVVLIDDDSVAVVPAAITFDTTGKIMTINPTDNMTAGHVHTVAVFAVTDVYGQTLANTIATFTVAS